MRTPLTLLLVSLFIIGVGCNQSYKETLIPKTAHSQYLKIYDVWVENPSGERVSNITRDSIIGIKYQNISSSVLSSVSIYVEYLDQDNKPIGTAAVFIMKKILPPNHIEVERQTFALAFPHPEDIQEEWSGKLEAKILNVFKVEESKSQ